MHRSMLLACILASCAQEEASSAESLHCAHSLAEFCAASPEKCVRHIADWDDISWCSLPGAIGERFTPFSCGELAAMSVEGPFFNATYFYASGELVGVVDHAGAQECIAGPPILLRPTSCGPQVLFEWSFCAAPDAGRDAAIDR